MTLKLTGQKFGRLTIVSKNAIRLRNGKTRWNCLCDCGNITVVIGSGLINEHTVSCGCLRKEIVSQTGKANSTHGMYGKPEYHSWRSMIKRCTNHRSTNYSDYGGRGITVCDRWLNSFEAFYEDMGHKPSPDHSIERRENNGNYEKNNCYWATKEEQANNKRNNVFYEYNGISKTISEWSREYNVEYGKLYSRLIRHGWNFERAVNIL
jgi:hypothetical protein